MKELYKFFNGKVVDINDFDFYFRGVSREVLNMINHGKPGWKSCFRLDCRNYKGTPTFGYTLIRFKKKLTNRFPTIYILNP
jgi:hypothetical protein